MKMCESILVLFTIKKLLFSHRNRQTFHCNLRNEPEMKILTRCDASKRFYVKWNVAGVFISWLNDKHDTEDKGWILELIGACNHMRKQTHPPSSHLPPPSPCFLLPGSESFCWCKWMEGARRCKCFILWVIYCGKMSTINLQPLPLVLRSSDIKTGKCSALKDISHWDTLKQTCRRCMFVCVGRDYLADWIFLTLQEIWGL